MDVTDARPTPDASTPPSPDAAPPGPRVVISEVVLTPMHDWSDGNPAYGGTPGEGEINASDQYVELHNAGGAPADLTGWRLEFRDTSVNVSQLGVHGVLAFSEGSTLAALAPGGYLVLGNPTGIGSSDTFVVLHDATGAVVDDVEVGGGTVSRDMEHDGVGDGAPDRSHNGYARGSFEEAIARLDGSPDTDVDTADFDAMVATPARANVPPAALAATTTPLKVVSTSTGIKHRVSTPIVVRFSAPMASASFDADDRVTVLAGTQPVALGFHTFEDDDHTLVINPVGVLPFETRLTITIKGGVAGVLSQAGATLATTEKFTVRTEPAATPGARVRINEICISPVQDWDDSTTTGGDPFDPVPGPGSASFADEWIELLYAGGHKANLTGYRLVLFRGPTLLQASRAEIVLGPATARVFGKRKDTTLASVSKGDRIVVGDPPGAIPTSVVIELRDPTGALIDSVEIGGNLASTDRGGDGVNTGAPGPGEDGRSTGLADEVVARVPDGADTNVAVTDFEHRAATLGAPN